MKSAIPRRDVSPWCWCCRRVTLLLDVYSWRNYGTDRRRPCQNSVHRLRLELMPVLRHHHVFRQVAAVTQFNWLIWSNKLNRSVNFERKNYVMFGFFLMWFLCVMLGSFFFFSFCLCFIDCMSRVLFAFCAFTDSIIRLTFTFFKIYHCVLIYYIVLYCQVAVCQPFIKLVIDWLIDWLRCLLALLLSISK